MEPKPAPGLTFGIILAGSIEFSIDGEKHAVSASLTSNELTGSQSNSFALNLLRHTQLSRTLQENASVCKVFITLSHSWLERLLNMNENIDSRLFHYIRQHHGSTMWKASTELKKMANDIVYNAHKKDIYSNLEKESDILNLCLTFLRELSDEYLDRQTGISSNTENAPDSRQGKVNATRIKQFIDERLFQSTSNLSNIRVETIASELGMSTRSMQRIFKQHYSQTVFDYIRHHRLSIARDALASGSASIGEAAYLAGYKHSSNFANAFKEAFGVAPGNFKTNIKPSNKFDMNKNTESFSA